MGSKEITSVLGSISDILYEAEESQLAAYMLQLGQRFEGGRTRQERRTLAGHGLMLFGGMNSFNDLVVQTDGRPDVRANRRLDELRTKLYQLLVQEL